MGIWNRLIGRPDKDDFAQMMIKVLRSGGEQRPIEYVREDFMLQVGEENRLYLGNMYGDYLAAKGPGRAELLAKLSKLTQPPEEMNFGYEVAKAALLPRVRERFYHETIRLDAIYHGVSESRFNPMPTRLLNEYLTLELVIDMPDRVGIVSAEQFKEWGISFDEAIAIGRENLWKLSTKSFQQLGPGLYVSSVGDTHDASRMFLHDLVWQHEVKGAHVVIAPNRNVLLVSGSEDEDGLSKMIELAEEVMQQPRAQTGMAFELDGSTWKPFLPAVESAVYHRFRNLALRSLGRDYADQKKLLDKIFETNGQDIFVANAIYVQRKEDGSIFSAASWAQNVKALLPQTEWIVFANADSSGKPKVLGYGRWERVMEVAGSLMQQTKDYPPRFHVQQFPSEEQLAAMDLVPMPP